MDLRRYHRAPERIYYEHDRVEDNVVVQEYATAYDMMDSPTLELGYAHTLGYARPGDHGDGWYRIVRAEPVRFTSRPLPKPYRPRPCKPHEPEEEAASWSEESDEPVENEEFDGDYGIRGPGAPHLFGGWCEREDVDFSVRDVECEDILRCQMYTAVRVPDDKDLIAELEARLLDADRRIEELVYRKFDELTAEITNKYDELLELINGLGERLDALEDKVDDLAGRVDDLEDSVGGYDDALAAHDNTLQDIVDKFYGGGEIKEGGGVTWGTANLAAVGNINLFSQDSDPENYFYNGLRTHEGVSSRDIWAR